MKLNIDCNNEYIVGKRDLFALMISFKYLLREENFTSFFNKLTDLFYNLSLKLKTISIEEIYKEYKLPLSNIVTNQKIGQKFLIFLNYNNKKI